MTLSQVGLNASPTIAEESGGNKGGNESHSVSEKNVFEQIFHALPNQTCILDEHGVVVLANDKWNLFAKENGGLLSQGATACFGANYIDVCRNATGECADEANQVADAIEATIANRIGTHVSEYACHSPTQSRWYEVTVTPVDLRLTDSSGQVHWGRVMVSHSDITAYKVCASEQTELQTRVEHKNAVLDAILQTLPVGIIAVDRNGNFIQCNSTAEALFRSNSLATLSKSEWMKGFELRDVEAKTLIPAESSPFARMVNGVPVNDEEFIFRHQSVDRRFAFSSVPLKSVRGPIGGIMVVRDVTESRSKDHNLRLLRKSIDHANDSMFVIEPNGRIYDVNDVACDALGYSREELVGLEVWDIDPDFPLERWDDDWIVVQSLEEGIIETELITKSGSSFPAEVSVAFFTHEGDNYFCTFARDITERRESEKSNAALAQELQDVARHAGMAEVAAGVLHNVGNVLNSISVTTSLLVEQLHESKVGTLGKVAEVIDANRDDLANFLANDPRGKHFPSLFAQLANSLKAEQGCIADELTELAKNVEHIKEIISTQQSAAKHGGLREMLDPREIMEDALKLSDMLQLKSVIQFDKLYQPVPRIESEKHKILQILINLIRNAVQALETSRSASKKISLIIGTDDESIRFEVRDNGPGISQENLKKLFQHGFTTKKEGHGFGLHSCANFAQEMKGTLAAFSEGEGKGASFILKLPIDA